MAKHVQRDTALKVWAIANQKGGVGKTTTTVTLGGLLADKGQRVLLVDLDPHGSLTTYFKYDPDTIKRSVFDLFQSSGVSQSLLPKQLVAETGHPGIDILPASTALATLERRVATKGGMGLTVSKALAELWDDYDFALIDSPPILGVLMINALAACEKLLIPVQTEYLAMKGVERLMRTLTMVTKSRKNPLPYLVIPTFFDRRTQASLQSLRALRQRYEGRIWRSQIPVDTKFRDASKLGLVPSSYDQQARGVVAYQRLLNSLVVQQPEELCEP